jgi:hypothetical protein
MIFSITLIIGAWQFDYIASNYLSELLTTDLTFDPSLQFGVCVFGEQTCAFLQADFWTISMAFWAFLQSLWVLFLVASQSYQIMVGYTTNEAVNHHRFDYLTHPDDIGVPSYRKRTVNPFSIGFIGNCIDFWSEGAGQLQEISWFNIYDVPSFLLNKALRRGGYVPVSDRNLTEQIV